MEQIQIQPQNNKWNYLIDPTFTNVKRLFVLSFQRIAAENNTTKNHRDSFSHHYVPNARIKDLNALTDEKMFLKNEEVYEKIMDMSNNNDYTTGKLLDFVYFRKNCRLIAIDLSKQTKLKDPQPVRFIGKLLNTAGATMFFIIEKSEEITLNFSQNSVTII